MKKLQPDVFKKTHQSYDSHCTLKMETTVTPYTDACNYQTVVHITTLLSKWRHLFKRGCIRCTKSKYELLAVIRTIGGGGGGNVVKIIRV
jgi:hypothetical protein